jgi:hypothetical protein
MYRSKKTAPMGAVFVCAREFSTATVDVAWVSLWTSLVTRFGNRHLHHRDDVLTRVLAHDEKFSTAIVDGVCVSLWTSVLAAFANSDL